jgi:hypothetical protein
MSALEIFVRIRQYKDRAAEFYALAAQAFSLEVRARYLAIADHYMALAEAEMRFDQTTRRQRLEYMRAEREKSQRASASAPHSDNSSGMRQAQRRGLSQAQMAAQARFTAVKPAH